MSPALIATLAQVLVQYGPELVNGIITLMKKDNVTIADVETLFANVKPYAAYNIPDVVPATPTSAA